MTWFTEIGVTTDEQANDLTCALTKKELRTLESNIWPQVPKKKGKEIKEKNPDLEERNFRVEDTSKWKEINDLNWVRWKESPEGDVREYLEGKYIWEQLFTKKSALREAKKAGKELPPSSSTYVDILNKKYAWNYEAFLVGEKINFTGSYNHWDIDKFFGLRCADGSFFWWQKPGSLEGKCWNTGNKNSCTGEDSGYWIRCLKQ